MRYIAIEEGSNYTFVKRFVRYFNSPIKTTWSWLKTYNSDHRIYVHDIITKVLR